MDLLDSSLLGVTGLGLLVVVLALLDANRFSSSWVSFSLLTVCCSDVLMDTEVSVLIDVLILYMASLADSIKG